MDTHTMTDLADRAHALAEKRGVEVKVSAGSWVEFAAATHVG